jgi:hypothetical protein
MMRTRPTLCLEPDNPNCVVEQITISISTFWQITGIYLLIPCWYQCLNLGRVVGNRNQITRPKSIGPAQTMNYGDFKLNIIFLQTYIVYLIEQWFI